MTEAPFFDDDVIETPTADGPVRAMARRQFGISLVVGFALLAVAGIVAMQSAHQTPAEVASRHRIIRVEAPQLAATPSSLVAKE
jgi:hypothetical protein